jgi:hypothetical protein
VVVVLSACIDDAAPSFSDDLSGLSEDALLERVRHFHAEVARAQCAELEVLAELARRRDAEGSGEFVGEEVALALDMTSASAANWVALSRNLERFPLTHQLFADGQVDLPHVKAIIEVLRDLPEELCDHIEEQALTAAEGRTVSQPRALMHRRVRKADPEAARQRTRQKLAERALRVYDQQDDTACLTLTGLPAARAEAVFQRLSAVARGMKADENARTIDQLRADLSLQLLEGKDLPGLSQHLSTTTDIAEQAPSTARNTQTSPRTPATEGQHTDQRLLNRIEQAVTATLTRLDPPERKKRSGTTRPAATTAMDTLTQQLQPHKEQWCQATTGPWNNDNSSSGNGGEETHGHHAYRPSARMRRLIQQQQPRCVFPTCRRPAEQCDLDRTIPHDQGGPTCPCNLAPLRRRHHRTKQATGWSLHQPWPNLLAWITPTGRWHLTTPEDETPQT